MAVIIRPKFNQAQIRKILEDKQQVILNAIYQRIMYVGEQFVASARNTNTYQDQTGNLRSSIGYIIVHNGQIKTSNFKATSGKGKFGGGLKAATKTKYGGTKQDEGVGKAQALAQEIADQYPQGFVLVCVAGMQYAASVESKGFDVITNSSIEAVRNLQKAVKELKSKISRV